MRLFNFTGRKPAHNPYNQLDTFTFKAGSQMTKDKANEVLNEARVRLTGVHKLILEEMRKDKSITGEEIKAFARINPDTLPARQVLRAYRAMWNIKEELKQKTKK